MSLSKLEKFTLYLEWDKTLRTIKKEVKERTNG